MSNSQARSTSLELKTSPKIEHRRTNSDTECFPFPDPNTGTRLSSQTGPADSIASIKVRSSTLQPTGFRRGGSVSPSVRVGPSPRTAVPPQYGKYLSSSNSAARVLVSPPHLLQPNLIATDSRKPTKPFTSAFESHLSAVGPGTGDNTTDSPSVHHHKTSSSLSLSGSLSSDKEESANTDRLVRRDSTTPFSPSMQTLVSGTRSNSFDSFNTKVHIFDNNNRLTSPLTPPTYDNAMERETRTGTGQLLFRRNMNDSVATNRRSMDDGTKYQCKVFDPRRNTLGATTVPFSILDSRSIGLESSKPIASYTRSTTTPIFTSIPKPYVTSQDQPTSWTTIIRREELKQPLDVKVDDSGGCKSDRDQQVVHKLDIATQTESSVLSPLSSETDHGSVVKPTDSDTEVEKATLNGWNANREIVHAQTDEDSVTEHTQTRLTLHDVYNRLVNLTPTKQVAVYIVHCKKSDVIGVPSNRTESESLQSHRLSLSRPLRSSLGSPTYGSTTTEPPRCRSVHFSSDVLVAHTGNGPEPLMLSSAPLKEPAPCEGDEDRGRPKPPTKSFILGPRRFVPTGRVPTESNFQELQISINQNQPQPRLPRPTPFRRNLVPRGASEPNL
ncbi:unnamed protein product [Echinostoma caproni]|uniref:DH domain-containing protein n=1 Tax=Echinostoma caproni TaxID=27848 RepID=A0A183A851_9TREM|nr:unnamed protein product [Echinostoma caproni]